MTAPLSTPDPCTCPPGAGHTCPPPWVDEASWYSVQSSPADTVAEARTNGPGDAVNVPGPVPYEGGAL